MRKEENYNEQVVPTVQNDHQNAIGNATSEAFEYLKSLPKNFDRPALDSYIRSRDSMPIDHDIAADFTDSFRSTSAPFYIPVSWSMTKTALVSLLGITSYDGHEAVNGIRFYAGLNGDNQLTLIAVSTMEGVGCDDDLTIAEQYPYYDYANPCPSACSSRGNLKAATPKQTKVGVIQEP